MFNATTCGTKAIHLAVDNRANFTRSDRKGTMSLINGGLAAKASPIAISIPTKRADYPNADSFWEDRHSLNSFAGGTIDNSRKPAPKRTETIRSNGNDFWEQRHSF